MKDKEKQIEEMAKVLHDSIIDKTWRAETVAKKLYDIAVPEDSVVLTKGEYSDIITDEVQSIERDVAEFWANGNFNEVVKELYNLGYRKLDDHAIMVLRKAKGIENRIRKETAEKFIVEMKASETLSSLLDAGWEVFYKMICNDMYELAKQFGVEIKE
jgi:hypothetical protein